MGWDIAEPEAPLKDIGGDIQKYMMASPRAYSASKGHSNIALRKAGGM